MRCLLKLPWEFQGFWTSGGLASSLFWIHKYIDNLWGENCLCIYLCLTIFGLKKFCSTGICCETVSYFTIFIYISAKNYKANECLFHVCICIIVCFIFFELVAFCIFVNPSNFVFCVPQFFLFNLSYIQTTFAYQICPSNAQTGYKKYLTSLCHY